MSKTEFDIKLLYDQHSTTEEGIDIVSSMYTVAWLYPAATSKTTARIRTTCIYTNNNTDITIHSGLIDKWSSEGWRLIDEFYNDNIDIDSLKSFKAYLLDMVKSFLLGIPLNKIITKKSKKNKSIKKPIDKKIPELKVINYDSYTKKSKKKKEDNDDFDMI